jgi:hypothetical protein
MSAFCCLKSSPQVDNSITSSNYRKGGARNSIRKDRNEMDLLQINKQSGYDIDNGVGYNRSTNQFSFE